MPSLIIVDTLSRNISGDENSSVDMPQFIQALDKLRYRYGSTVLVVHHSPHGAKNRSRGHTSFRGALDWEYRMSCDEVIRFENTKVKDHETPEPLAFELRKAELDIRYDDGKPVTSAIMHPIPFEPKTAQKRPTGKNQKRVIEVLEHLYAEHRANVEVDGRDPNEARVTFDDWREACFSAEIPRSSFYEVRRLLAKEHRITEEHGFVSLSGSSRPSESGGI